MTTKSSLPNHQVETLMDLGSVVECCGGLDDYLCLQVTPRSAIVFNRHRGGALRCAGEDEMPT